jgi:hypothetical protein
MHENEEYIFSKKYQRRNGNHLIVSRSQDLKPEEKIKLAEKDKAGDDRELTIMKRLSTDMDI